MAKKTAKTIEKLRTDVQALSEAVWALKRHVRVEVAAESAANGSRNQKSRKLARLEERSAAAGARGLVSAWGTWRLPGPAGERTVRWQLENTPAESLVPEDLDAAATRLAAIGHRQRVAILLALLHQPASVSDLVATLALGTSGAAYHHLNVLQGAGLVMQEERGVFEVAPDQAAFIVGILSALAIDPIIEAPVPPPSPNGESSIGA
jgi:DNA-binding transcriptional ArsR family regulator